MNREILHQREIDKLTAERDEAVEALIWVYEVSEGIRGPEDMIRDPWETISYKIRPFIEKIKGEPIEEILK